MAMRKTALALTSLLAIISACGQKDETKSGPPEEAAVSVADDKKKEVLSAAAAREREKLRAMRAQIARIDMNTDTSFLSDEQREVVNLLNQAANLMSEIYLRQIHEKNPLWRREISDGQSLNKDLLLDMMDLHFGPWDSLNHQEPFYGTVEHAPGAAFYPEDMTKAEFENWIATHEDQREIFTSGYTLIRRTDDGGLSAVPYSVAYHEWLEPAAALLREAADITTNESLKKFLSLRAESFMTDDYYESELAWMDLEGPIEVAIGPYEVYTDQLFGYKTAFEAFVTIKDPAQSAALDKYKGLLRDMEAHLPVAESYKNFKRGFESPIAVVNQVHGGGDNVPGVQTIAFNLPNDERVREAKGAKKVLLNNVMGAKFDRILSPMADRVLVADQAGLLLQKYMGASTLFHELSHSLGPGTITIDGIETTVSAQLKELSSAMEEGKADVMSAYNILYMMDLGELPIVEKQQFLATYFVGLFRSMRFGIGEAHGKGASYQYSYYKERDVFAVDETTGLFRIDFDKFETAIGDLTGKVVILQGDGQYEAAKAFLDDYGKLDDVAEKVIASMTDIPVDIQPVYPDEI